jgi:methyl-accepting chemotaxis protein
MRNLKTGTKIVLLTGLLLIFLLLITYVSYRNGTKMGRDMESLYANYSMPAVYLSEASSATLNLRQLVTMTLFSNDADYVKGLPERMKGFRDTRDGFLDRYKATNMTSRETELLNKLVSLGNALAPMYDKAVDMGTRNEREAGYDFFMSPEVRKTETDYFAAFAELTDLLIKMAEETKEASISESSGQILFSMVLSAIAVVLSVIISVVITRSVTKPLNVLRGDVDDFSKGDLTVNLSIDGRDEIAQMGLSLRNMADQLNKVISAVNDASDDITGTSQEFSALAQETNASVEEFRANVDEMGTNLNVLASTGEEVNASVEEVAAGAQATAEKGTDIARQVDEAMSAGQDGMASVRRAVSGIDGVAKNASEAAQSVQELGTRTRQIQNFVAQIGGIADQTNLLALNAAIEAARAGEAGRGFAVVAEEVRKLAEDSNVAAKNIAELATTITGDLDRVVNISLDNAKASEDARELSRETENIIESMISYLKNISGSTQDLAAVSQEQAASSEEIAEAVQNIATKVGSTAEAGEHIRVGVGDVAAAAERMAQGAENLSSLSLDLHELLKFFKMREDALDKRPKDKSQLKALPPARANAR